MRIQKLLLLSLGIATLFFVPILGQPASADSANKVLTLSPATARPSVNPGETVRGSFQVVNQGETGYVATIYAAPYSVKDEDYDPDFSPIPNKPNPSTWLKFDKTDIRVAANQTITINYAINVPANTTPGGYYAVAFAEVKGEANNAGVVVNQRVGEIFYIHVNGGVSMGGKVNTWLSSFLQTQPLTATLKLENSGGIDYVSDVHVAIQDVFGNTKYDIKTQKAVLPQTIRRIPIEWKQAPAFGLFKINGTVTVHDKTMQLGSHYILVASKTVRLTVLVILVAFVAYGVLRVLHTRRKKLIKES